MHNLPDPGRSGTVSGSFTFTLTQTFPFELFVFFVMTCDVLKTVLGITKDMSQNVYFKN